LKLVKGKVLDAFEPLIGQAGCSW